MYPLFIWWENGTVRLRQTLKLVFFRILAHNAAMSTVEISFPYAHSHLSLNVPADQLAGIIRPRPPQVPKDEEAILAGAMSHPIGTARLAQLAHGAESAAVVISDLTRPCPSLRLLPPVLQELQEAHVPKDRIIVVLALGLHRPMTEDEIVTAVGEEVYSMYHIINHDPEDTLRLGTTKRGTPIDIYRPLVQADVRICLGNVEFHYFAGYSGGAKAVLPGCASAAAIAANHAWMLRPEACGGRLDGNPVREDLEEAVDMLGVDFILNVVVDAQHRITGAVAGDVTRAHRAACEQVAARGQIPLDTPADIVVASAGGYPKDINLYQAHKALENASLFLRDGGILILAAACSEGVGQDVFADWMTQGLGPLELAARIQQEFILGGHKASAIGSILSRKKIFLVSDFHDDVVRRMGMEPFHSLGDAFQAADAGRGEARVLALPEVTSVLPAFG